MMLLAHIVSPARQISFAEGEKRMRCKLTISHYIPDVSLDSLGFRAGAATSSPRRMGGFMKMRSCLLILLVATLGLTASAQEIKIYEGPPDYSMTKMRITLVTGGDDLRYDSRVSAFIITRSGRRIQSPPLNCVRVNRNPAGGWDASGCGRIPNGTRRTFVWE